MRTLAAISSEIRLEKERVRLARIEYHRAVLSVLEAAAWQREHHTKTRNFRVSETGWNFILRGAGLTQTMTHVVLVGSLTESLITLSELGEDIVPYLRQLRDSASLSLHAEHHPENSVYQDVIIRLDQHGKLPRVRKHHAN